jgi:putative ABC transport system ATP-binding protein
VTDAGAVLRTDGVGRQIAVDGQPRAIVHDFSFSFARGGIYTLIGPSGAGKSSVLRLLNRLDEPTSGAVYFDGRDYRSIPTPQLRRSVAYLFQTPHLFPGTVADNLRYVEADLSDSRIVELLGAASLGTDMKDRDVERLSVGEKQRVAIARLMVNEPPVVLLDEPTSALDPTFTLQIERCILDCAGSDRRTIIAVSHDPAQARRLGGHGLLIVGGRLVEHGPIDQLLDSPQTPEGRRYRDKEPA